MIADYNPSKFLSTEAKVKIADDPRSCAVLAILNGLSVKRVRNIKRNFKTK